MYNNTIICKVAFVISSEGKMLKLNDKVMYGSTGVCTVERIEEKEISR